MTNAKAHRSLRNAYKFITLNHLFTFLCCAIAAQSAVAADIEATLTLRNHIFTPAVLELPTAQLIKLTIVNEDDTPEEFESHSLNREKVVQAKSKIVVFIGPLAAGKYEYFGEYNPKTAKGMIVAK